MANNRLYFCEVDDNGKIVSQIMLAKHFGGAWSWRCDVDKIDAFFDEVFCNGNGIALTDDYENKPLEVVYPYNDSEIGAAFGYRAGDRQ